MKQLQGPRLKSVGLWLGRGKVISRAPLSWTDDCCILLDVWLGPDLQLEKKWP